MQQILIQNTHANFSNSHTWMAKGETETVTVWRAGGTETETETET